MIIEVLLTEAEISEEFAESFEARDLPEKFFYWSPLSVQAWKDLSAESHPALVETWREIAAKAPGLTQAFGKKVHVISFGAGDGSKDRMLLQSLQKAGRDVHYHPVDASQILLETACAGAEDDDCEATGIKADISSPMHMLLAADAAEAPRLLIMSGNTLGGFDPLDQVKHLADAMHTGDILIIDAQLDSGDDTSEETTATPAQSRFSFAPLASVGLCPDDGEIRFKRKPDARKEGMTLLATRFHAARDLTMSYAGRSVSIGRGERIFLNLRYLFTEEAFRWILTGHAELRIVAQLPSADGRFLTCVCIK